MKLSVGQVKATEQAHVSQKVDQQHYPVYFVNAYPLDSDLSCE